MSRIELIEATLERKSVLRQLIELYEYDFSEFNGEDVNEFGRYDYKYLDHYWTDEGRHPFFIMVDGAYAGFVLINSHSYVLTSGQARSVAEFFVMRKYRRGGVGREAARLVFDRFPGEWEVRQHGDNLPSQAFWERVIGEYTEGRYRKLAVETESWQGQGIIFDNSLGNLSPGVSV